MKVNILGAEYDVIKRKYSEDEVFERRGIDGYCDPWQRVIVYCDLTTYPGWEHEEPASVTACEKEAIRHEIVHAFLDESGLGCSSFRSADQGWSKNEEMVDWIALQGPKLYAAWLDAGAL